MKYLKNRCDHLKETINELIDDSKKLFILWKRDTCDTILEDITMRNETPGWMVVDG